MINIFNSFIWLWTVKTSVTGINGSVVIFVFCLGSSTTKAIIWRQGVEYLETQAKVEIEHLKVGIMWLSSARGVTPEIYQKLFYDCARLIIESYYGLSKKKKLFGVDKINSGEAWFQKFPLV